MAEQLTFDLPAHPAQGLDDFLVTPANEGPMKTVEQWRSWPASKLLLTGETGTGKTHLAHVWASLSGARVLNAAELADLDIGAFAGQSVAVDDANQIAGDAAAEAALFHLHNLVLAEGGHLLVTASPPPAQWGLTLPDLASRMQGTHLVRLDLPDDMLLSAVLVKLFHERQIVVKANLIDYLLPRTERSLAYIATLVDQLDKAALSEGRAVTRALAAKVLQGIDNQNDA